MKRMLVLPVTLIAFIALLSACKKSSSASYSVTANVGGTNTGFNQASYAVVSESSGTHTIIVQAVADGQAGKSILFSVANSTGSAPIIVGTTYVDTAADWDVEGVYTASQSAISYAGTILADDAANSSILIPQHLKVTFTSIDSTAVKGTFSGDFYLNGDPSGPFTAISNGSFFVKIQR